VLRFLKGHRGKEEKQMTDRAEPGNQEKPEDANQRRTSGTSQGPDPLPTRIGVVALGLIALLCVVALIYLSGRPEPPGTPQAGGDAQQVAPEEDPQATEPGPAAVQAAGDTAALGLLGQIVGVLGTVAAAAVGGIAGLLTGARAGGTTPPPGG
jgi:hypothetical protein